MQFRAQPPSFRPTRAAVCGLLVTASLLAAVGAGASPDEEEGAIPAAAALPPVRVRLASLDSPSRVTVKPAGTVLVQDPASGEAIPAEGAALQLSASGNQVSFAGRTFASLRIEASSLAVDPGKGARPYPGALLLTAKGGKLSLVNECELESYVAGVLAGECPALFHPDAIRAMAVTVRSYSYRKAYLGTGELCDTTHCQVYRGAAGVKETHLQAVEATRGLCAVYDGEVIDAVYSSDCGGVTEANEDAWKGARPLPYLRPVVDAPEPSASAFCASNRAHEWKLSLTREKLQNLLGGGAARVRVEPVDFTQSGRVRKLQLSPAPADEGAGCGSPGAGKVYTGDQWRRMLGLSGVKSLLFEIRESPAGVELAGRGYGHGVGLCQFGANGMGKHGIAFTEIVKHYYTGVEVVPAPDVAEVKALIARKREAARRMSSTRGGNAAPKEPVP